MNFKTFFESESKRVSVYVYNTTGRRAVIGAIKALKWGARLTYYSKAQQMRDGVGKKDVPGGMYSGTLTDEEIADLEYVLDYMAKEWNFASKLEMGVEIYAD